MARRLLALALLGPTMLFGLYRCSYLPVRCSRDVQLSERELVRAADHEDGYASIVAARAALDRLRTCFVRPLAIDPPLLMALSYRFLQRHDAAIESYQRALTIDRRPEIYLGLGLEQWKAGRRHDAIESLTLACAFSPTLVDAIEDGVARQEVIRNIAKRYGPDWLK